MAEANEKYDDKCKGGTGRGGQKGRDYTDKTMRTIQDLYGRHKGNGKFTKQFTKKVAEELVQRAQADNEAMCFKTPDKTKDCEENKDDEDCGGLVAVCEPREDPQTWPTPPAGVTVSAEQYGRGLELSQVNEYIIRANNAIPPGGSLKKIPSGGAIAKLARDAAAAERAANPGKYPDTDTVVGHAPDYVWGGLHVSPDGFMAMSRRVNSSIGKQNGAYPNGYKVTEFVRGAWGAEGCRPMMGDPGGTYSVYVP